MNKVISGLLGAAALVLAASANVAVAAPINGSVAAPVLTDGAQVQTVQYAYGYNRPGYRPHYRHYRPHRYNRGRAFGRFHGRPHYAGRYHR